MKKTHSGLALIGVGVGLNMVGRLLSAPIGERQSLVLAGALLALMILSVAVGLFGIVRLVVGLITKS